MSAKKLYVYSTLANDQHYTTWKTNNKDLPQSQHVVEIKGGAGVANKHFQTAKGVPTEITAEDLVHLNNNHTFCLHRDNGHIIVGEHTFDIDKVVADMNGRDASAPLVPADYDKNKEIEAPKTPEGGKGGENVKAIVDRAPKALPVVKPSAKKIITKKFNGRK